jgi:hypothetical protein
VVAALAAGVADLAGIREAVGGLVQQGAEDVDRAALEAFAADQDLSPVGRGVRAGELPAAGGEAAQVQPPAPGVAAGGEPR